jgi:hypothetical protein
MNAKSIQYSIPDPCDKSWNEMTPDANGRFCGSCEKSVVDFTNMSDFSIVNYFEKHKNEKVCGRFTKPQLERVYQLNQPVFAPAFDLRAVVLGLALTTFCAVHSFSQTDSIPPVLSDTTLNRLPSLTMGWVAPSYDHKNEKAVTGTVCNSVNSFQLVTVTLKNATGKVLRTIHPDEKGHFKLDLYWNLKPVAIEVSGVGYESRELFFSSMRSLNEIQVHLLDKAEMIRGEVIRGDVKAVEDSPEDQILQKIEMGNVNIRKTEK